MNAKQNDYYVTGTAIEAINYTAGGANIDWMYTEHHVVSYVLEVLPPCGNQWCYGREAYETASIGATTMVNFVSLVMGNEKDSLDEGNKNYIGSSLLLLLLLLVLLLVCRRNFRLLLYRFGLPKHDPTEIVPLNA